MKARSRLFAAAVTAFLVLLPALTRAQDYTPGGREITPDPLDPNVGQGVYDPRNWTVAPIPNLDAGSTLGALWVEPSGRVYVWASQQRLAVPLLAATPRFVSPDETPIGGELPPTFVKTTQLIAVRGPSSSVALDLPGEVGASVYGNDARDIYAATNVAGGGVRLYHFNGLSWGLEALPDGITGPAGSIVGDHETMYFRAGSTILEGHARTWTVAYSNKQLLAGSELVRLSHEQVLAPGDHGQAAWNGVAWSWQPALVARHLVGAWGARDTQGNLHLFATGSDPQSCGMLLWQGNAVTPGGIDCCYDLACKADKPSGPGTGTGIEVWGHAVHDIYAIGEHLGQGTLMHFDGTGWLPMAPMTQMPVATAMGDAPNGDFWIALSDGRLMHGVLKSASTIASGPASGSGSGDNDPSIPIVRPMGGRSYGVEFHLARAADVSFAVYDLAGRRVATFDRSSRNPGVQHIVWNARGIPCGVYFGRIEAAGMRQTVRIMVDR